MKTYQSGTNEKRRGFFKRHWHGIVVITSILVIAAVITVSVVFSRPGSEPVEDPVDPPAVDVTTEPKVVMPMSGPQLGLGYAHENLTWWDTLEVWKVHPAVDFVGSGDVVAILDGKVKAVEKTTLEGTVVTVEHANGYVSVYKSLGSDVTVKAGDTVKSGDKLGVAGTSMSELNTGDHLHLEIKKDGKYVDPMTVLPQDEDK